jgi:hypothetical protein
MKANLRKLFLVGAACLLVCVTDARAQGNAASTPPAPAPGDHSPQARAARSAALQKMLSNFTLTPLQRAQVNEALLSQGRRIVALRTDPTVNESNSLDKIREIIDSTDATLKGIFSPEQYKMWIEATKDLRPPGTSSAATNNAAAPKPSAPKPAGGEKK